MQPAVGHISEHERAAQAENAGDELQLSINKALARFRAGDSNGMRSILRDAAALARQSEQGSYVFGLFFFNTGDPATALDWFEKSLMLNPWSAQAAAARGIVLHQLGRSHEALSTFQDLQQRAPQDPQAFHMSGIILQGLGRYEEAMAAYAAALRIKPDYCDSRVNRGVVHDVLGRLDEALADFDEARHLRPNDATILFNRGSVLQRLGRFEEALAAYDEAGLHGADNPELDVNRGNVLQSLARFSEALACYERALALKPDYAQAHYNRGLALQRLRRFDAALAAYEAAIAARPNYPEAFCNRGNVLSELGRRAEALASFATAARVKPDFVPALINRANLLFEMGQQDAALAACADVLAVVPDHAQALCIRGAALHRLERLEEALASLDRALQVRPNYPEAWLNRGNVLQEQGRLEEALASYDRALALRPDYPEVISSRGVALKELGDFDAALAAFDHALRLKPNYPDARNNRAGILLLRGELGAGFDDFESRWDRTNAPRKPLDLTLPVWNGEPLEGRRLLVFDEQGLGDLLQFSRYLPQLVASAAEVSFFSRRNMFRLLSTLPQAPRFIDVYDAHQPYDYQIALMSLPRLLTRDLASIPAQVPYLRAEPERIAAWSQRLDDCLEKCLDECSGRRDYRIGICWHGNPKINLERNIPLPLFSALAAIPGVRLISLVKDMDTEAERTARALGIEILGKDFDQGPDSFLDTAAVMHSLDLIVTSDTSIAHLAGALGRPVFLAVKRVPDWRWMAAGAHSAWYPSMRIFRQQTRGDWQPVLAAIAAAIEQRMACEPDNGAQVALPSGIGELIDKITILEIKASKIRDPGKLANVDRELLLLRRLKEEHQFSGTAIDVFEQALKQANAELWEVEDALRSCERRRDFGDEFVALARSVYKTNDRRAELKKRINMLCNSAIVEEKSYC